MLPGFQQEAGAERKGAELHQDQPAVPSVRHYVSTQAWRNAVAAALFLGSTWPTVVCVCGSFKTVDGKKLCARPSAEWVKEIIKHVDANSGRAGETSNMWDGPPVGACVWREEGAKLTC